MSALVDDVPPDWYVDAFDEPCTALLPWTDDTEGDVERVLRILDPPPWARILDLACGAGRHAFTLARRGFGVVGVDISEGQLETAYAVATPEDRDSPSLDLKYLQADLRDLSFAAEFDAVLNLHSGALGYFEDDAENRRTFEVIAEALRPGGRTLMQLPNVRYAESRLPAKTWTVGKWTMELLDRHWNADDRYVEGSITPIVLDDPGSMRSIPFRQRLYSIEELFELFCSVGMSLEAVLDETGGQSVLTEAQETIFVVARRS